MANEQRVVDLFKQVEKATPEIGQKVWVIGEREVIKDLCERMKNEIGYPRWYGDVENFEDLSNPEVKHFLVGFERTLE